MINGRLIALARLSLQWYLGNHVLLSVFAISIKCIIPAPARRYESVMQSLEGHFAGKGAPGGGQVGAHLPSVFRPQNGLTIYSDKHVGRAGHNTFRS